MNIRFNDINITINCKTDDIKAITAGVSEAIKPIIPEAPEEERKIGIAHRPSARDIARRNRPQSQIDGERATKESLDQIPELKEAKEKLEAEKKAHEKLRNSNSVRGIL